MTAIVEVPVRQIVVHGQGGPAGAPGADGGGSAWGGIGGTLSNQTDLQAALNAKAASSHNHSASEITSGTLAVARGGTGASSFTGGQIVFVASGTLTGSVNLTYASNTNTFILNGGTFSAGTIFAPVIGADSLGASTINASQINSAVVSASVNFSCGGNQGLTQSFNIADITGLVFVGGILVQVY